MTEPEELAEKVAHAPVRKAIADARAAGVPDDILEDAIDRHAEQCRRRGIPEATLRLEDLR